MSKFLTLHAETLPILTRQHFQCLLCCLHRPVLRAKEVSWQSSAMVAPGLKIDDSESWI